MIGQRLLQRLAGQGVHDVQIEGVEVAAGLLGGAARFVGAMNAPQRAQVAGVKALHANRQPVYPRRAIAGELGDFQRAGVGFQGNFCVRVELEPGVQRAQQAVDMRRAEQAGRAALATLLTLARRSQGPRVAAKATQSASAESPKATADASAMLAAESFKAQVANVAVAIVASTPSVDSRTCSQSRAARSKPIRTNALIGVTTGPKATTRKLAATVADR